MFLPTRPVSSSAFEPVPAEAAYWLAGALCCWFLAVAPSGAEDATAGSRWQQGETAGASLPGSGRRPPRKATTTMNMDGTACTVPIFGVTYMGVRVTHVGRSGLAELAGIKPGDVLLSLNTYSVRNAIHADRLLNQMPSGNLEIVFARPCQEPAATGKQGVAKCYKLIESRIDYVNPYKEFSRVLLVSPAGRHESPARLEARAMELINLDRSSHGEGRARLLPLRPSPVLTSLARETAAELVKRGPSGQASHGVESASQRLKQAGFQGEVGENILTGVLTVEEAQEEFMSEPADDLTSHRANILNPDFRYVGVGIALRPDHTLVVVQVFTREKPEPTNQSVEPGGDGKRL